MADENDGLSEIGPGRWRDRDRAVEELFFLMYPRLVRTGFGLVGDWALAEQLVQEAFLRVWRRWGWLRDPQAAPAYLHRTVVNLARGSVRRRISERSALVRGGLATGTIARKTSRSRTWEWHSGRLSRRCRIGKEPAWCCAI